jgi:serine/threonine-protein kinase
MRGTVDRIVSRFELVKGSEPHWSIGFVVSGKWKIARFLGAGGMGAVFEAQHRNGKRVALKVLHRHLHSNPRFKTHFLREGYLANRVEHPDVASVLDDGETSDGDVYLVMELLHGETLEARRKAASLSTRDALRIADRILDVLAMAHAKGIVHRDIKPANVFLTIAGDVKLLDFGIASLREKALLDEPATLPSLHGLGTPSFMAPEQARGRKELLDERADIWSLGAVLFTLLSGRYVHETQTPQEALIAAATMQPRLLGSFRPDLPALVTGIVDRALAFDTQERWRDAQTMQEAVRRAASATAIDLADDERRRAITSVEQATEKSGQGLAVATSPSLGRRARAARSRTWMLLGAAMLLGVCVWGGWRATSSSPPAIELASSTLRSATLVETSATLIEPSALDIGTAETRREAFANTPVRITLPNDVIDAPTRALPSRAPSKAPLRRPQKKTESTVPSSLPANSTTAPPPLEARPGAADDAWLDRQK